METSRNIFMKAYNYSMTIYTRDVEDLTSRREKLLLQNKKHLEYIKKVNEINQEFRDGKNEIIQLVKDKDEDILTNQK